MKKEEQERKCAQKATARAVPLAELSDSAQRRAEAVSIDPENPEMLASLNEI